MPTASAETWDRQANGNDKKGSAKTMARILVAEDETAVRTFVTRALAIKGHKVTEVCDGLQALQALDRSHFQLLITDIVMPGLDGIGLALKVARDHPALPVLLITGYAAERQRAHNLDELICEVVTKPFTLQQICEAAENALERSRAAVAVQA